MITLHCLAYSRALRVLWMLQELEIEHELKTYDRTETFSAPDELKEIHPLGKSPTITDGDLVLAESATILRYVRDRYAPGAFTPETGSNDYFAHEEWLDYAESSLATPIMSALMARLQDQDVPDRAASELETHFAYLSDRLNDRPFLMGHVLTLADIQMTYMMALGEVAGLLGDHPTVEAYWRRLQDQPGFKRATERGGPMKPPLG